MCNQNIISNKFDLNLSTTLSSYEQDSEEVKRTEPPPLVMLSCTGTLLTDPSNQSKNINISIIGNPINNQKGLAHGTTYVVKR